MIQSIKQQEQPIGVSTPIENPSVSVSVIIPVTERHDDLGEIYRVHAEVLNRLGHTFEFIFVIDGGFEKAADSLKPLVAQGEPIRMVNLHRSFGEATALMVGFEEAKGEKVITLSSYLQVIPEGLAKVLQMIEKDYDLVVAIRSPRVDSWLNRIQTFGFHALIRWMTGVRFRDISCGLKGIRRRVLREIQLYGDLHRFLPLLAYQRGLRVAEVDIPQHGADSRTRVYHPGLYIRRLLDILTLVFLFKFSKKPLRFFGLIGAGLFGGGVLISFYLGIERILGMTALSNRPLLILGVLLMVLGVQIGAIGLLGEMIIFTHARKMKDYTIERFLK